MLRSSMRKALPAVLAAAASAGILASTAFAQGPGVGVSSGTAEPGGEGTVTISASEIADPGLGAWTLTLIYDLAIVSVVNCEAAEVGINQCGPDYDSDADTVPDSLRLAGVDAEGVTGDFVLATVTFQCVDPTTEVSSDLTLVADTFANSGPAPTPWADINPTVNSGTFACTVQPTATNTVAAATASASATATVGGGPASGSGPTGSESNLGWVIAALAGTGLAAFAGLGALRLRSRRA